MKKILLTLMSAAMITSVSAQQYRLIPKDDVNFKLPEITGDITTIDLGNQTISTRVAETDLIGKWIYTVGDRFGDNATGNTLELPYDASLQKNGTFNFVLFQSSLQNPVYNEPPIAGIFDEKTNTLVFTTIGFGEFDGRYMYQFTGIYDWSISNVKWGDLEIPYDPATGTLTFPENAVIAWPAFSDPYGNNHIGYFGTYMVYSAQQQDLNGVEGILDDFNGQPVYYNLSGIKVDNPQKGQVVIEKKGNNTKKIVF